MPGGAIRRDGANAAVTIIVGSKNFTEQKVLGEIYAQGLAAAGFRIRRNLNLGDEHTAQRALERGIIDGYPEYTGTALLSLCGVRATDVPSDAGRAYGQARDCLAEDGLQTYPPTPFTSSNEVGVRRDVARREHLRTISDLRRVARRFTLYGSPECRMRMDCLAGLREVYGLRFGRFAPVALSRRFEVLDSGPRAASIVFTTDPQIAREDIVLLEDDRGMFPPSNSTFVVRQALARRAGPALGRVIATLQRGLTARVMQRLNAGVDIDGRAPRAVAAEYLRSAGLVG